jgi:hypothetical protein
MASDPDRPLDEFDEIRLSRRVVRVSSEQRRALAERLDSAGFVRAADDLRSRRAFEAADKPDVLGVLNAWLDEVKAKAFGGELMALRHELDHDIKQKR